LQQKSRPCKAAFLLVHRQARHVNLEAKFFFQAWQGKQLGPIAPGLDTSSLCPLQGWGYISVFENFSCHADGVEHFGESGIGYALNKSFNDFVGRYADIQGSVYMNF